MKTRVLFVLIPIASRVPLLCDKKPSCHNTGPKGSKPVELNHIYATKTKRNPTSGALTRRGYGCNPHENMIGRFEVLSQESG
jgi:hypothetical protein